VLRKPEDPAIWLRYTIPVMGKKRSRAAATGGSAATTYPWQAIPRAPPTTRPRSYSERHDEARGSNSEDPPLPLAQISRSGISRFLSLSQRRSPFLALTFDVNGSSSFGSRYSTSRDDGGNAASYKYPGSGSQQPPPDHNKLWWQPGTRLAVPGNSAIF
jgi:hypothetical protein